jgi:glycosyltransferase involved in cell wall biosynthesis
MEKELKLKVCFLYCNLSQYTKNQVLLKAFKDNNLEIIDCGSNGPNTIIRLISKFFQFLVNKNKADIIYVGFIGYPLVKLVKIFTNKPVVFDAYMSLYNTMVEDKKKFKKNSFKAKLARWLDISSCRAADIILLDTNEHIDYFVNEFKIPRNKFRRLYIGALDSIFYPRPEIKNKVFTVEFHGGFIPLQGVETIIDAAKILKDEDILIKIAGSGQTFNKIKHRANNLTNIEFLGNLPLEKVPSLIASSDVGLGIFGTTDKALRVIPNKAYEVLAMKKPLITESSKAARELLNDKDVLFTKPGDPKSLAEAILKLKDSKKLRESLASDGYKVFKENASPKVLGNELKNLFLEL